MKQNKLNIINIQKVVDSESNLISFFIGWKPNIWLLHICIEIKFDPKRIYLFSLHLDKENQQNLNLICMKIINS